MAKGCYSGGGTIIGPRDVTWFGTGDVKGGQREDAGQIAQRRTHPLTADAERRIGNLRVDVVGLKGQLARLDKNRVSVAEQIERSQRDLAALLARYGLPLDAELRALAGAGQQAGAATDKTTRQQRRKRARETVTNG